MATNNRRARKTYKKPRGKWERRKGITAKKIPNPAHEKTNKNPIPKAYLCAVPSKECSGAVQTDGGSVHSSPAEVLRCKGNWLVKNGYKKRNSREFEDPETGRILLLTNKPQIVKRGKVDRFETRKCRVATW